MDENKGSPSDDERLAYARDSVTAEQDNTQLYKTPNGQYSPYGCEYNSNPQNSVYGQQYYGGYHHPSGYTPASAKTKSSKLLVILLAVVSVLLVASIIAIAVILNPLGDAIAPSDEFPAGANTVIDKEFTLSQAGTPGTKFASLADAYDATYKVFAEINISSTTEGTIGAGSGFIVARKSDNTGYYIVTNNHVVEGATKITVRLFNGKEYTASNVVLRDEFTDLAVITIAETETLQVAKLGKSGDIRVGEDAYVIGNPLGTLAGTLTSGIISAKSAEIYVDNHRMTLIQTTAAINPGNSGGPIFNMSGEVIGVVNSKYAGTGIEGLGFAIPMDIAVNIVQQMIQKGYVDGRHDLGITAATDLYGIGGVWISEFEEYSSLLAAGVPYNAMYAYQIVSIDGNSFMSANEANNYIDTLKAGDKVTVTLNIYERYFNKISPIERKTVTFTLGQMLATN